MAATRAIRADRKEAESSGIPVLERLQYPTVQSSKTQDESSPRGSHHGSGSANSWVTVFPSHADGFAGLEDSRPTDARPEKNSDGHRRIAELEQRLQQEQAAMARAVADAREQGRREARQAVEQQIHGEQQRLQAQILQSLEQFRLERQNYFHNVEGEVVRLALAIAARVLHREAHLDPLLLSGAVRVALEKLGRFQPCCHCVFHLRKSNRGRLSSNRNQSAYSARNPGGSFCFLLGSAWLITELGTIKLGVRA